MSSRLLLVATLVACSGPASSTPDNPDGAVDGDGTPITPDASLCTPACEDEPNADDLCTAFATCESVCSTGFSRCEGSCVAESPAQCGDGCEPCRDPDNGSPTCSDGVCGVACDPGYVPCTLYAGPSCCAYDSEVVAPTELGGAWNVIAVDASGTVHAAYHGVDEDKLYYAVQTPTGWRREEARHYFSGTVGATFDLALGVRGPVVVYTNPGSTAGLFVAERRSTGWSHSRFLPATPLGFDVTSDRANRLHLCWTSTAGVSYAIRTGDQWTISTVSTNPEARGACAVAADADGNPHVLYHDTATQDVIYATPDGAGGFTATTVDREGAVGREIAIAIAPDGAPHVALIRSDTYRLRYGTLINNSWVVVDAGTARARLYPRIIVPPNGVPLLSYYDDGVGRLALVSPAGGVWMPQRLEDISRGPANLAVAPDGTVWLGTSDNQIAVHRRTGTTLATSYLEREDTVDNEVTLLHRGGQPVLVYTRRPDRELRRIAIAIRANGAWTYREIAGEGWDPTAAIDANGRIHVAYESNDSTIRYAVGDAGDSFTSESLATGARDPAIAIDSTGAPHVVYDTTANALVKAVRGGGGWTPTTLDTVARHIDPVLRFGPGDVAHILWLQPGPSLWYTTTATGAVPALLESAAGNGHDLYVTPTGVAHACFLRVGTSRELRHGTRLITGWTSTPVAAPGTRRDMDICAIGAEADGTVAIARSFTYGAGLGEVVVTHLRSPVTHTEMHDDYYSFGLSASRGASGLEVAAAGQPYAGTSGRPVRVRWNHR